MDSEFMGKTPALEWLRSLASVYMTYYHIFFIVIALGALALGLFIFLNPTGVIDLQKKFYHLINWNMEPVSMAKEIRNTRMMALMLIIFVFGACLVVILN